MKIKTRFLVIYLLVCVNLIAQINVADSIAEAKLKEAKKYLMGIGIPVDEPKAFGLYAQLAQAGNAKAMNVLGQLYSKGKGVVLNENLAIQWYLQAAQNGIVEAWYNIGLLYKESLQIQNFAMAYQFFDTAAKQGNDQSIYALAYLHYKGLGCNQDYSVAASLFKKGAVVGRANSMYFYGLCWRNGYGVSTNQDSAAFWLQKAANKGYKMAISELANTQQENSNQQARTISTKLKSNFISTNTSLNSFRKIQTNIDTKVIQGEYEGDLVRYDWSGENAISSSKLKLKLLYNNDVITGNWIENDSIIVPLEAHINLSSIVFNNMNYLRKDHYNPKKGAKYIFKNGNLQWSINNDTVYLIGTIQLFSKKQNEPDKPLLISLKRFVGKSIKDNSNSPIVNKAMQLKDEVNAYPNPFVNTITVDFVLKQKSIVNIQLETLDGRIVYEKKSGLLETGSYTFPLYLKSISAGTYILKVMYGKVLHTTKVVRL